MHQEIKQNFQIIEPAKLILSYTLIQY